MNKEPRFYLVLDQGGQSSRASLYNQYGECIAYNRQPVQTYKNQGIYIEHDAYEILHSLEQAMAQVFQQAKTPVDSFITAGLATQRASIVCWDKITSQPLSRVISWQDVRAEQWLADLPVDPKRIQQISGLKLSAHYGASKLHWCLQHIDAVKQTYDNQRLAAGPLASFIIHSLLKERPCLVDIVNAARTQCLDIRRGDWSDELLTSFGLPKQILPQCTGTHYPFGLLAAYPTIPLSTVTGDQAAALFAHGELKTDTIYINIGTGAFLLQPCDENDPFHEDLLTSVVMQDTQQTVYAREGTVNGAAAALNWLAEDLHCSMETLLQPYSQWRDYTGSIPLFINTVSGLGSPYWYSGLVPRFTQQADSQGKTRSVIESIVFLVTKNVELLAADAKTTQIIISGGLCKPNAICQWLADLTQIPVLRPNTTEATSRGLACLMAGLPGEWNDTHQGEQFSPCQHSTLQQRYQRWKTEMQTAVDSVST